MYTYIYIYIWILYFMDFPLPSIVSAVPFVAPHSTDQVLQGWSPAVAIKIHLTSLTSPMYFNNIHWYSSITINVIGDTVDIQVFYRHLIF